MKLPGIVKILLGAGLLAVLPLIAGRPTVYPDTSAYYRLGTEIGTLVGLSSPASNAQKEATSQDVVSQDETARQGNAAPSQEAASQQASLQDDERLAYTVAGARSPYWSFALFVTERMGSLWLVVALHALLAAWLLSLLFRVAGAERFYLPAMAVLAVASSLPLIAALVMPDFLAATGVLALVLILFYWPSLTLAERIGLWASLAFGFSAHTSHWLTALLALIVGAYLLHRMKTPAREIALRGALVGAAVIAAIVASEGYGLAVRAIRGETIQSPPFLTARIVADGPGRNYLRAVCANGETYALCAFADRRLDDSNDFLWSTDPTRGVLQFADYDTRLQLVAEQPRFVLGTLAHDPLGVIGSSWTNFWRQLFMVQIFESTGDPTEFLKQPESASLRAILPGAESCLARDACGPRLPLAFLNFLQELVAFASVIAVGVLLYRMPSLRRGELSASILLIAVTYVFNAGVCGVLAGAFERYQARVVWLLPAAALLLIGVNLRLRRRGKPQAG